MSWKRVSDSKPDKGVLVATKCEDENGTRNEQNMTYDSNLWFAGSTYTYYSPTHWRLLTTNEISVIRMEEEKRELDRRIAWEKKQAQLT